MGFPNADRVRWITNLWPTVHLDSGRNPTAAVEYVLRDGDMWATTGNSLCTGPLTLSPTKDQDTQ
jgi:hypothetical protein